MSGRSELIIYRGRIVAVAGPRRVQFIDGLDPVDLRFVAVMALCKREIDEGRIAGPFTSELAARWARLMLIGPHHAANELSDHDLATRLDVPEDQIARARAEFKYQRPAFG